MNPRQTSAYPREDRLSAVKRSLLGMSVGDGLGRDIYHYPNLIEKQQVPPAPWRFTDDTRMALAIARVLASEGHIDQDRLAAEFARDFEEQPERGYGAVAYFILHRIASGMPWREASTMVYGGQGSLGNGAAMRAAPVGAYFFDDPERVRDEARLSAEITHAHPEGQAGAIAVALASMIATQLALGLREEQTPAEMLNEIIEMTPNGPTCNGLSLAVELLGIPPREAGRQLGTGVQIIAEKTVLLALWCAMSHLKSFEDAIWTLMNALEGPESDSDTLAAIVGGIVAIPVFDTIPRLWLDSAESIEPYASL
jgi:ADP-ribosylglycohydrolase